MRSVFLPGFFFPVLRHLGRIISQKVREKRDLNFNVMQLCHSVLGWVKVFSSTILLS